MAIERRRTGYHSDVNRLLDGYHDQPMIQISPLAQIKDPMHVPATGWDTAIVPVTDWQGTWADPTSFHREPLDSDLKSIKGHYLGRHRQGIGNPTPLYRPPVRQTPFRTHDPAPEWSPTQELQALLNSEAEWSWV